MPHIIELPWPPSLNNLYPSGRGGRRFLSPAGRDYKQRAIYAIRALRWHAKAIVGPAELSIWVFPPNRLRRDVSNLVKIVEDSLTAAGVWADDSQVVDLHVFKRHMVTGGRVDVDVRAMVELSA